MVLHSNINNRDQEIISRQTSPVFLARILQGNLDRNIIPTKISNNSSLLRVGLTIQVTSKNNKAPSDPNP